MLPVDKQITSISGEFFVAAELAKRNFQVSLTLGNAKAVDIFAVDQVTGRRLEIEVKTLRKGPNCFSLKVSRVKDDTIYFFVYLNEEDCSPTYYIISGAALQADLVSYYGSSLNKERQTVNDGPLRKHKDDWGTLRLGSDSKMA